MVPRPGKKANHVDLLPAAIPPALPPSVEEAYRRKCLQLKRRTNEVEEDNEAARVRLARLRRGVEKLRLERAFLLDQLAKRTSTNVEDSEGSPSPPPTVRDEHEHGRPSAHSPSPAPIATAPGPRSRQKLLPSGFGSASAGAGTGTDQDIPLRQPQEKPLRSKRGHRKPSVVAALEPGANGPPATFINQSVNNLSPTSDTFSQSVTAGDTASSQQLKETPAPRSNGVGSSSSTAPKNTRSAFELYCTDHRSAALESKAEGVTVDEELARGWKELPETQRDEYKSKEAAAEQESEKNNADDKAKSTEDSKEEGKEEGKQEVQDKDEDKPKPRSRSPAEDTPARDEDVDMDNDY